MGFPIDSRICTDRIPKLLAQLDHFNRFVEHAFTRAHKIMRLAHTIQMNVDGHTFVGLRFPVKTVKKNSDWYK